jgi:2-aminoadipate transaminase
MEYRFSRRMANVPKSFLETLFAVSNDPSILSFAGGLPSSKLIDVEGIAKAAREVLEEDGCSALQYTTTDGYLPLRQYIADRYKRRLGLKVSASEIQIVNGSQQCLDLVAKIFIDPGDPVGIEHPGYLGALEAFSLYEPEFHAVPLEEDGPDLDVFRRVVKEKRIKFFYAVPNSQNPSGCTYSPEKRRAVAEILRGADTIFYEDDAFGELFFDGEPREPIQKLLPEKTLLSGSFSKIVAPGMRIGWMCAPVPVLAQFNVAKQAADLHSNFLSQKILHRYLCTHDLSVHTARVAKAYGKNCRLMCDLFDELLPELTHTRPQGGMFMTATLPKGLSSMKVFEEGIRQRVAVLPGVPFFTDQSGERVIRLNFSNTDEEKIHEGMNRLARVIRGMM